MSLLGCIVHIFKRLMNELVMLEIWTMQKAT